jgi:hypothetical protein
MTAISPAVYWRQSKNWPNLLGQTGTVILATTNFALVDINGKKYELMTVPGYQPRLNDKVVCVFRRLSTPTSSGLINYGLKIRLLKSV